MRQRSFKTQVVTVDESWVSHFMPETKQQSKEWSPKGAKPPRKAKRTESQKKLMYCLFFDRRGPLYKHFVPKGTTINTNAADIGKALRSSGFSVQEGVSIQDDAVAIVSLSSKRPFLIVNFRLPPGNSEACGK